MAAQVDKQPSVLRSIDWLTIAIYLALLVFGWVSVCGASYTYGDTDIFSLDSRSGMQIVWIGTSIVLGFILLMLDDRLYEYVAYLLYGLMIIALIATIFNPHEIKGSRSWLVLGPVHIQPAEFSKFVTALALAKLMSTYGFTLNKMKDFALAVGMLLLPMLCIVLQKETGSALVYLSFSLMLYREGMPGSILFTAVAMVIYFVVGIRFEEVLLWDTPTSVGKFSVLVMVQLFTAAMLYVYLRNKKQFWHIIAYTIGITILALLFSKYVIPFDIVWLQMALTAGMIGYLIYLGLSTRIRTYYFIALFAIGSVALFNLSDHILNNTLEPHQRTRINVLLGIDKDIKKTGYNVHQSQIAIGSGGITGKGFLNGTQTKLKFVPEQDTDFIFCTVGEEEGFGGCAAAFPGIDSQVNQVVRTTTVQVRKGIWLLRAGHIPLPRVHQCGYGAGLDSCDRYSVAVLQLWRLLAMGLHLTAVHLPSHRCRKESGTHLTFLGHLKPDVGDSK